MLNLKRYTLKKSSKLTKSANFQNVYRLGKVYVDKFSILYIAPNDSPRTKIGFAVGKKLGNAVLRNSMKRRMREVFRHIQNNIQPSYDLVWVARKSLIDKEARVFYQVFERILKKACVHKSEG